MSKPNRLPATTVAFIAALVGFIIAGLSCFIAIENVPRFFYEEFPPANIRVIKAPYDLFGSLKKPVDRMCDEYNFMDITFEQDLRDARVAAAHACVLHRNLITAFFPAVFYGVLLGLIGFFVVRLSRRNV